MSFEKFAVLSLAVIFIFVTSLATIDSINKSDNVTKMLIAGVDPDRLACILKK